MSKNSNVKLVKIIANLAIFLEFTDEGQLDPDLAVKMMEQMAAELQSLNYDDRKNITKMFQDISREYTGDKCEFIKELPESFGLI
ncbi:hypothetical protein J1786_07810 [Rahnella sp. L72c]|uniref:Uncharacterized protein n=1 Tax=Rahnella perminowiae TaxID=2816244 RepID=A0ABS6KYW7_9GAMM|nr:hypothetical protein [Rahnella perminowiae]MBU9834719.1 hypothetical protein [Rahnella perminowiae]